MTRVGEDVNRMKDYPDRMTPEQARRFGEDVLNIVSQIPCGRVTTYGHIAALAGWPSHSRMVGRTLRYTPGAEHLPCHRVVNKCDIREQWACGYGAAPLGAGGELLLSRRNSRNHRNVFEHGLDGLNGFCFI